MSHRQIRNSYAETRFASPGSTIGPGLVIRPPKGGRPKRADALTDEEIWARCDAAWARNKYPSRERTGVRGGSFYRVQSAWLEANGIPRHPCGRKQLDGKRKQDCSHYGRRKDPLRPSVEAMRAKYSRHPSPYEQDYHAGQTPKLDKPKPERPKAGSVAELVWLYDHSRWRRAGGATNK
jgi:hypothetical protein